MRLQGTKTLGVMAQKKSQMMSIPWQHKTSKSSKFEQKACSTISMELPLGNYELKVALAATEQIKQSPRIYIPL